MKKLLGEVIFSSILAMGIGIIGVQAATLEDLSGQLPKSLTTYVENVSDSEGVTINGIAYGKMDAMSDTGNSMSMISKPKFAESDFTWPYENTANYQHFTDLLSEGSDNDGNADFLIDPYSCEGVEVIPVTIVNENGEEQQVTALAYKFDDLEMGASSLRGMKDAREHAAEYFLNLYNEQSCEVLLSIEDAAVQNPKLFWLSGEVYLTVPSITEEAEESWSGLHNAMEYSVTYLADLYCVLAMPEIGYDIRHELYRHSTPIKESVSEMNSILERVVNEVDGLDEIQKAKYFNNWLTSHNELNTTYTTDEELAELFEKNPDSLNCLSALRGGTGEFAPTAQSYASAFKALCDAGHVTCNIIPGKAGIGDQKISHAWNEVKIYQSYFAVDTAWNDLTDKKNVALSGDEREDYFLVGGNSSLPYGNENLSFWTTHSAKKESEMVDGYNFSYSKLGGGAYETSNFQSMKLTTTDNYLVAGYESLPIITAELIFNYPMDSKVSWSIYRVDDGYTLIDKGTYHPNISNNSLEFPVECASPGVYSVRATYRGALYEVSGDIRIKVVRFDDVNNNDWFKDSVAWAIHNDITAGYTFTTFAPHINCTRGQLVTFLWRFFDCPKPETENCDFKDIASNAYYRDAVLWAIEHGYVIGYTEDTFAPDVKVTRAELATILWRVAGKPSKEDLPDEEIPGFSDVENSAYYYRAVNWAAENNITKGYSDDIFAPNASTTRAEIVTFLYRAKDILQKAE